VEISSENTYKV